MKKILLALLTFSSLAMGVTQDKIWRVPHGGSVGAWGPLNLSSGGTNAMSGQLPFAQGGIGIASCASGAIMYSDGTTAVCDTAKLQVDTGTGALTLGAYGAGLLHSDGSGAITSSAVTGSDIVTNVDLPGIPLAGGLPIVTGNGNNSHKLIITQGAVSGGCSVLAGVGWSCSQPGGTGNYRITFSSGFPTVRPVVTVTIENASNNYCTISNAPTTSSFDVHCANNSGTATNAPWDFIAIGW